MKEFDHKKALLPSLYPARGRLNFGTDGESRTRGDWFRRPAPFRLATSVWPESSASNGVLLCFKQALYPLSYVPWFPRVDSNHTLPEPKSGVLPLDDMGLVLTARLERASRGSEPRILPLDDTRLGRMGGVEPTVFGITTRRPNRWTTYAMMVLGAGLEPAQTGF